MGNVQPWPISLKLGVINSLETTQLKDCYAQGENKSRLGANHHSTFKLNGYFIKMVKKPSAFNISNARDHLIQNMIAMLKKEQILKTDLDFPKTHAILTNLTPQQISHLEKRLVTINLEIKLLCEETLNDQEKIVISERYKTKNPSIEEITGHYQQKGYALLNKEDTFDLLTKKAEQLESNLTLQKSIANALNPDSKNNKYIAFFMEDINVNNNFRNQPSDKTIKSLNELNQWLNKNLGVYHWDCEKGRNTMSNGTGKTFLIDPAFTITDPKYRSNFDNLIKYRGN